MKYRLAGRLADINPEIETVRTVLPNQPGARFVCEGQQVAPLIGRCFEPIGDMPPGDKKQMSLRHRGTIEERKGEGVLKYTRAGAAKRAVLSHGRDPIPGFQPNIRYRV